MVAAIERPPDAAPGVRPDPATPAGSRLRPLLARLTAALRRGREPGASLVSDPHQGRAYAGAGLLFALSALPYLLATADGFAPGLSGVPAPGIWDNLGRAIAVAREGPLPDGLSRGPTSPAWMWLLVVAYLLVGWTGLSIAVLAKLFGFAASLVGAVALYHLAVRATGTRWPGVLLLALLGLDPALAYGRVAGGESPLAFALTALAVLALVRGRPGRAAWLLGLLALTRPDGVLVAAVLGGLFAARALREGAGGEATASLLLRLLAPAGVGAALWALHGLLVGEPQASPLAVAGSGPTLAAVLAVWRGWLAPLPLFGSFYFLLTLGAWAWAAVWLSRRWGPIGLAPALAAAIPLYSLLTAADLPSAGWSYDARRLGEPALPWFAFALALGLSTAGEFIWSSMHGAPARLRRLPLGRLFAVLPISLWAVSALLLWARLPTDFAFGARNVAEAPLALGAWIAENTPSDARLVIEPGAEPVRALAGRPIREVGRQRDGAEATREVLRRQEVGYLVAYRGSSLAAWPHAREVARAGSERNVTLPAPEIALFRLQWNLPKLAASDPHGLRLRGYSVLDRLDVGDAASETAHFYASPGGGALVRAEAPVPTGWVADDGRAQETGRGVESFTLQARQGRDLLLAVRYDAASRGILRVEVNRQAFELRLRECAASLCDDVLVIPGEHVGGSAARLNVSFAGTPGARIATYHYWAILRD